MISFRFLCHQVLSWIIPGHKGRVASQVYLLKKFLREGEILLGVSLWQICKDKASCQQINQQIKKIYQEFSYTQEEVTSIEKRLKDINVILVQGSEESEGNQSPSIKVPARKKKTELELDYRHRRELLLQMQKDAEILQENLQEAIKDLPRSAELVAEIRNKQTALELEMGRLAEEKEQLRRQKESRLGDKRKAVEVEQKIIKMRELKKQLSVKKNELNSVFAQLQKSCDNLFRQFGSDFRQSGNECLSKEEDVLKNKKIQQMVVYLNQLSDKSTSLYRLQKYLVYKEQELT